MFLMLGSYSEVTPLSVSAMSFRYVQGLYMNSHMGASDRCLKVKSLYLEYDASGIGYEIHLI